MTNKRQDTMEDLEQISSPQSLSLLNGNNNEDLMRNNNNICHKPHTVSEQYMPSTQELIVGVRAREVIMMVILVVLNLKVIEMKQQQSVVICLPSPRHYIKALYASF